MTEGFREYPEEMNPLFHIPDPKALKAPIMQEYTVVREQLASKLKDVLAVTLTTDLWMSRNTEAYITVTCHYVDENFVLQSSVLTTSRIHGPHTAENITSCLRNIIELRKLDNAHSLNLAVTQALEKIEGLVRCREMARNIVTFFKQSGNAMEKLWEMQDRLEIPRHKLLQEVCTRWNSTYLMFKRIIEQKNAIVAILATVSNSLQIPNNEEWSIIESAVDSLEPFYQATVEMSAEYCLSASKIIPVARQLTSVVSRKLAACSPDHKPQLELLQQLQKNLRERERFLNLSSINFSTNQKSHQIIL